MLRYLEGGRIIGNGCMHNLSEALYGQMLWYLEHCLLEPHYGWSDLISNENMHNLMSTVWLVCTKERHLYLPQLTAELTAQDME